MYKKGRAWVELNIQNLQNNVLEFQRILPEKCNIMPAVKANAYGHGVIPICKALQEFGVHSYCVASLSEAIELRVAGIDGEILILGYTHPDDLKEVAKYNLTQSIIDMQYAKKLGAQNERIKAHIAIDTGMHRLGESWENVEQIATLWNEEKILVTGVYSHLCVADSKEKSDREYTALQIERFHDVTEYLEKKGCSFAKHLQSSYGVLNYESAEFDYARIGIALYGILSADGDVVDTPVRLKPVMELKARIENIKKIKSGESIGYGLTYTAQTKQKVAAVSIGYADGIPRSMSNTGYVLYKGKKAAIIGRICMDCMLIDVTEFSNIMQGDEVTIIGKSGEEEITAELFAKWNETITNEIMSRLGERLERIIV